MRGLGLSEKLAELENEIGDQAVREQFGILSEALIIYAQRNVKYKDNWRRFGWRGCLFRVRERAERAWDNLWDAVTPQVAAGEGRSLSAEAEEFVATADYDDLLDMINFACFTIRAVRENNRDGSWW